MPIEPTKKERLLTEAEIQDRIRGELSNGPTRLFRNQTGFGWSATKQSWIIPSKQLLLFDPRAIRSGLCVGGSDLIGLHKIKITKEMEGQEIAVFVAMEIKKDHKAKISKEQQNFINFVNKSGGIAGVATSIDEAREILNRKK
jgi:hypothetical protein